MILLAFRWRCAWMQASLALHILHRALSLIICKSWCLFSSAGPTSMRTCPERNHWQCVSHWYWRRDNGPQGVVLCLLSPSIKWAKLDGNGLQCTCLWFDRRSPNLLLVVNSDLFAYEGNKAKTLGAFEGNSTQSSFYTLEQTWPLQQWDHFWFWLHALALLQ